MLNIFNTVDRTIGDLQTFFTYTINLELKEYPEKVTSVRIHTILPDSLQYLLPDLSQTAITVTTKAIPGIGTSLDFLQTQVNELPTTIQITYRGQFTQTISDPYCNRVDVYINETLQGVAEALPVQVIESFPVGDSSITFQVWFDSDRNGNKDANEHGIANVTIELFNQDSGTTTNQRTLTNEKGIAAFTNLVPGEYYVQLSDLPSGYRYYQESGLIDRNGKSSSVQLSNTISGESNILLSLPVVAANSRTGSVGDFVWDDQNINGVWDNGEPGVANVTVTLWTLDGTPTSYQAKTDSSGFYLIGNVPPGCYRVHFTDLPEYYEFVTDSKLVTCDGVTTYSITVAPGSYIDTVNIPISKNLSTVLIPSSYNILLKPTTNTPTITTATEPVIPPVMPPTNSTSSDATLKQNYFMNYSPLSAQSTPPQSALTGISSKYIWISSPNHQYLPPRQNITFPTPQLQSGTDLVIDSTGSAINLQEDRLYLVHFSSHTLYRQTSFSMNHARPALQFILNGANIGIPLSIYGYEPVLFSFLLQTKAQTQNQLTLQNIGSVLIELSYLNIYLLELPTNN